MSTCSISVLSGLLCVDFRIVIGGCAPLRVIVLISLLIFVRSESMEGIVFTVVVVTRCVTVVFAAISSAPMSVRICINNELKIYVKFQATES